MKTLVCALAMLLTATAALHAADGEDTGKRTPPPTAAVPPTAIDREENNPAKAAVVARESLKTDEDAARKMSAIGAEKTVPAAEAPGVVRMIDAALRKDPRTAALDVELRVAADGVIGLHGTVPSRQSSAAAESVAAKAAGPNRIQNNLIVTAR